MLRFGFPTAALANTVVTTVYSPFVTTTVCPMSIETVHSVQTSKVPAQKAPGSDVPAPIESLKSAPASHTDNSFKKAKLKTLNKVPSLRAAKFERSGYYSAEEQKLDNLVFLANHGGDDCSGVFD